MTLPFSFGRSVDDLIAWRAAELISEEVVTPSDLHLVLLRDGSHGLAYKDLRNGRLYLERFDDAGGLIIKSHLPSST